MTLHWHRRFITRWQVPSASHRPAQQCLFLYPLTRWDHGQGATSTLPLSLAPLATLPASTGCRQGVSGVGGPAWLPPVFSAVAKQGWEGMGTSLSLPASGW